MKRSRTKYSKFLSLVLRHNPEAIDIRLDGRGWADVQGVIEGFNRKGYKLDLEMLKEIVASNDKQRFRFNEDLSRIRANQGHSRPVDLDLEPATPPQRLYHGTATRFWPSIEQQGLISGSRQHVHLSRDRATAAKVGVRHGKLLILVVNSEKMHECGHTFYLSENGVWLTDHVPVAFITADG